MSGLELIRDRAGTVLGSIEYEPGYGVHARKATSERATFLTNGYRAAIGSYVLAGRGNVAKAKGMARRWVKDGVK